jgi:hypothetical protein
VANGRERLAGLVLAGSFALVAMAVNTEGCSSDSPNMALGDGHAGHGGAGNVGRGGIGGSIGGGGGTGGGTAGMAVAGAGGAGGQTGCQLPAGAPGTWVEIAPPPGQANFHVTDAFAVGLNDLFFAGFVGDPVTGAGFTEARILRWTQGCWAVELSIPRGAGPIDSPSVHGLGTGDVWAAASDALYHRDAQGWTRFANEDWRTQIRQPPSFSSPPQFFRVRAAAANLIWAAVTSNILRWDGQAWTAFNFDDPNYPNESASVGFFFRSIWIDSPTSVWVGGGADQVGNTMEPSIIHHFDGANWTHTSLPALSQVDAIWRGGSVLWLANPSPGFTILRFDGTAGTTTPILGIDPNNPPGLTSLFGRGATDLWAGGDDVAHFDGQSWSLDPGVPAAARSVLDERNTYVTGDAGSVWLATSGPRFFRLVTGP